MLQKHVKIFSGTEILVNRLSFLLDQEEIPSIINNAIETARLSGFGPLAETVDLYIFKKDLEKATPILKNFQKEISE